MRNGTIIIPTGDMDVNKAVSTTIDSLMDLDMRDVKLTEKIKEGAELFGKDVQKKAFEQNDALKEPIGKIAMKGEEGGEIANSLTNLKEQIDLLDPSKVNFEKKGIIAKIFNPTKKYFQKYEKADKVIGSIVESLDEGAKTLTRDNVFINQSTIDIKENIIQLDKAIAFGQALDKELEDRILDCTDDEHQKFLKEEILYSIKQRTIDLQQQLVLNQQGLVATQVISKNNKELIKGVSRAKNVTVFALHQAVVLSNSLANQRLILDQIEALNDTTSNMILNTSRMIGQQGVAINKQASGVMLDADKLKESFIALNGAMQEMETYRAEALPKMAEAITELDELSITGRNSLQRLEATNIIDINLGEGKMIGE